ncbi:hypothetical protein [uncultured Chitinophaga sp.]|uniref:hypothetical protein n=1 Tax=uncultured Chitinophaga sp. TaxID=339340 RepID=UPI0025FCEDF6|nr:hypothetical protein [uncultured Chitinophaga sp.]
MKRIEKLTLAELASEASLLTKEEKMSMYGGSGPIDGLCAFEAMEILSAYFGCNYSMNYYQSTFTATYGFSSVYGTSGTGPAIPGPTPSLVNQFMVTQFSARNIGITDIETELGLGRQIMVDLKTGQNFTHAVVITSFDSSTGEYIYRQAGSTGRATPDKINGAVLLSVSDGYAH